MTDVADERADREETLVEGASDEAVLPSNEQMLEDSGMSFHLFIDSAEGVSVPLDARRAKRRAEASRERLLPSSDQEITPEG
jgi:hypothetical protein